MKNALFRAIKISEFGKWVERHNGDHVIHVTSDDVTGDRKVAQPSRNTVLSAAMSKSVNTNLIQKSFLLNIMNRHKGVIAQTKTEDITIQSVRWVCGIHGYFVSLELSKVRVSQNLKHFQWMHLGRRPVTRRVASQCECKGAPAWVIATCEVQLSGADSQTIPTVATGVWKLLCCRLTITFTVTSENLSLFITLLLYWSLYNYASHATDNLTPKYYYTRCRQSHLRCVLSPLLLHLRLLGTFQSDIPLFTLTRPAKHSPNQG